MLFSELNAPPPFIQTGQHTVARLGVSEMYFWRKTYSRADSAMPGQRFNCRRLAPNAYQHVRRSAPVRATPTHLSVFAVPGVHGVNLGQGPAPERVGRAAAHGQLPVERTNISERPLPSP